MPVWIAEALLAAALGHVAIGAAVALAFLLFGLDRVAPPARGAHAVRPLLVPGLVLLWPWVLRRWAASRG